MAGDIDLRKAYAHVRGVYLDPRDFASIPDLATIAAEGLKLAEGGRALVALLERTSVLLARMERDGDRQMLCFCPSNWTGGWHREHKPDCAAGILLADIRKALG
jgi:hypothetical protein